MARGSKGARGASRGRRRWGVGRKLAAAGIVTIAFVGVLEIACRLLEPDLDVVTIEEHGGAELPRWFLDDPSLSVQLAQLDRLPPELDVEEILQFWTFYRRDPELHYRLHPNLDAWTLNTFSVYSLQTKTPWHLDTNAAGFRGRLLPEEPLGDGRRLVVCMGDSSTFGWGVEEREAYPARLQALLAAREPGWVVVNRGHPGFTSWQGRVMAREVARCRPEVVVVSYGGNDHTLMGVSDRDMYARDHALAARLAFAAEKSAIVRMARRLALRARGPQESEGQAQLLPRVPVPEYGENLRAMIETLRGAGARIIFLPIGVSRPYREVMQVVAGEAGAAVVDSNEVFQRVRPRLQSGELRPEEVAELERQLGPFLEADPRLYLRVDPTHPNAIGHDVLAAELLPLVAAGGSPAPTD